MQYNNREALLRRASSDMDLQEYLTTQLEDLKSKLVTADNLVEIHRLQGGITELGILLKQLKRLR